ncbi:MAG: NUDIX domain-containing protein [Candidatus Algichlamydia australiensis]|nr:NUDIX domain-containing protein [Chlamydiales bacterium]
MFAFLALTLLTEPAEIVKAEQAEYQFWQKRGFEQADAYSRVGVRAEDPYMQIVYDPVDFENGVYGLYKRILLKRQYCSLIPVDEQGNVYLTLIQEFTGERAVRAPLSKEVGDEFLGNLHLETGMLNGTRPCYRKDICGVEDLPPLPKDAIGYLKVSPGLLRKLAREQKFEGVICKDASIYLGLLQEAIGDGGDTFEITFKKPSVLMPKAILEDDGRIETYIEFLNLHPKLFDPENGHLLRDPEEILLAESYERERFIQEFGEANIQQEDYRAGVIYQDPRLTWVRFPMRFADGSLGLKNEIIQTPILKMQNHPGAAIVAQDKEGKFLFLGIYRVSTHEYEAECAKGARELGESFAECAAREAEEELRRPIHSIQYLGLSHTGLDISTLETYPVYLAKVGEFDDTIPVDPSEGVEGVIPLVLSEIKDLYKRGSLELNGIEYTFADPLFLFFLFSDHS